MAGPMALAIIVSHEIKARQPLELPFMVRPGPGCARASCNCKGFDTLLA